MQCRVIKNLSYKSCNFQHNNQESQATRPENCRKIHEIDGHHTSHSFFVQPMWLLCYPDRKNKDIIHFHKSSFWTDDY